MTYFLAHLIEDFHRIFHMIMLSVTANYDAPTAHILLHKLKEHSVCILQSPTSDVHTHQAVRQIFVSLHSGTDLDDAVMMNVLQSCKVFSLSSIASELQHTCTSVQEGLGKVGSSDSDCFSRSMCRLHILHPDLHYLIQCIQNSGPTYPRNYLRAERLRVLSAALSFPKFGCTSLQVTC